MKSNTSTGTMPRNILLEGHTDVVNLRESLRVQDEQSILLGVAWVTHKQAKFAQKFPKVFFVNATSSTSVEKRELVLVCGKDSNNSGFTAMRVFVPSEKQWVYSWIYNDAIPNLLGKGVVQKRLVLTDGDRNNYAPLESCIATNSSSWAQSFHGLCEWHLLGQSWQKQVTPTIQKDKVVKTICIKATSWIKSWFWNIETEQEFELSKDQLLQWLLEKKAGAVLPENTYLALRDLFLQQYSL
jgi:hypothetical protein